jgi:predicted kinase|tara:strand:+ start:18755 stop:19228 length:474 start_codon:yes stop_codon:yes gene_type:complete
MNGESEPKPLFIMMVGIPGSGKSQICEEYANQGKIIICPDELRKSNGGVDFHESDELVWLTAKIDVVKYLNLGYDVVLDATNTISERRVNFIQGLPRCQLMARVVECEPMMAIARILFDLLTGKDRSSVPPDVVMRYYKNMGKVRHELMDEGFEEMR